MTTTKTGAEDVRATVQRLILEVMDADPEKITDGADLIGDLNADSFGTIELTIALEDEFEIEIPDAEVESLKTVADIVTLVSTKLAVAA